MDLSHRPIVLAFDIGIRNLAWCSVERTDLSGRIIHGWQNQDLLQGGDVADAKASVATCNKCSAKASFGDTCLRHCPNPLRDLSGAVLKKIPSVAVLKAIAEAAAISTRGLKKDGLLAALSKKFTLPNEKVKLKKAIEADLSYLHDSIRTMILSNHKIFAKSTHILLENQPAFKNPTMKSVQMLLFATLRDLFQPNPPWVGFVHASKKVQGKTKGDAGYKDRKQGSEARVASDLQGKGVKVAEAAQHQAFFQAQAKKSDLADAYCMCMDKIAALQSR